MELPIRLSPGTTKRSKDLSIRTRELSTRGNAQTRNRKQMALYHTGERLQSRYWYVRTLHTILRTVWQGSGFSIFEKKTEAAG
jgi:hypothetical protein